MEQLQKEKYQLEAERDYYKSKCVEPLRKGEVTLIANHLKTIADLRAQLSLRTQKAEGEGGDLELEVQLEEGQHEYTLMRQKYEEKLAMLQASLAAAQRERDLALRSIVPLEPVQSAGQERTMRVRYEEKIRQLSKELQQLKTAKEGSSNNRAELETLLRNTRAALQTTKSEKTRLAAQLEETRLQLSLLSQNTSSSSDLTELKIRDRQAAEQIKRLRKSVELQKAMLQKRAEQHLHSKNRLRQVLGILRQKKIPFSSPSPFKPSLSHPQQQQQGMVTPSKLSNSVSAHDLSPSSPSNAAEGDLEKDQMIPRRKDMFARLADAASLSLASRHLAERLQRHSFSHSPLPVSVSQSPSQSHSQSQSPLFGSHSRDAIRMAMSPMKVDYLPRPGYNKENEREEEEDLVEFYRRHSIDPRDD